MCYQIANWMLTHPPITGTAHVTFAGTVDAIQYGSAGTTLTTSPAALWNGVGYNYYETRQSGLPIGTPHMAGVVANVQYPTLNHVMIGVNPTVWFNVDTNLQDTFDELSE
jgi:hypothetical protein